MDQTWWRRNTVCRDCPSLICAAISTSWRASRASAQITSIGSVPSRRRVVNIRNARWKEDPVPVDGGLENDHSRTFSRAYLRYLFVAGEMTASTLNTLHNIHFYLDTMRRMREAIAFGSFETFRQRFHETFPRHRRPR